MSIALEAKVVELTKLVFELSQRVELLEKGPRIEASRVNPLHNAANPNATLSLKKKA